MSNLRKNLLGGRGSKSTHAPVDCTPIKWNKYFDIHECVTLNNGTFHYYNKGNSGPLLVAIHGGGYSGLTWSLLAQDLVKKIECRVLAIDLRGHGNTQTDNDDDLSLEQLANDISDVLKAIFKESPPPIILIGHSLGGAVAVETAATIPNLAGLCVIDVVEGTAMDSLASMQNVLRGRPSGFKSIEHAVQWGFRGGSTQNIEAARVSMPSQIKNIKTGVLGSEDLETCPQNSDDACTGDGDSQSDEVSFENTDSIKEEEEEFDAVSMTSTASHFGPGPLKAKPPVPQFKCPDKDSVPKSDVNLYTWRIDLRKTEKYWSGWFKGLSDKFLHISAPKILLLANISGLDTSLTVGQMQGKFQLQVLPRSGHAIHEDQPEHVADIICTFLVRQKLAVALEGFTPILPGC